MIFNTRNKIPNSSARHLNFLCVPIIRAALKIKCIIKERYFEFGVDSKQKFRKGCHVAKILC